MNNRTDHWSGKLNFISTGGSWADGFVELGLQPLGRGAGRFAFSSARRTEKQRLYLPQSLTKLVFYRHGVTPPEKRRHRTSQSSTQTTAPSTSHRLSSRGTLAPLTLHLDATDDADAFAEVDLRVTRRVGERNEHFP